MDSFQSNFLIRQILQGPIWKGFETVREYFDTRMVLNTKVHSKMTREMAKELILSPTGPNIRVITNQTLNTEQVLLHSTMVMYSAEHSPRAWLWVMEISNTRKESFSRGNIRKDPVTVLELTPIPMGLISLGNIQKTNGMVLGRCTIHKESVFLEH